MNDVRQWLASLGFGQYAGAFEENAIDWELLPKLNQEILKDIGVEAAGHRIRILEAIEKLDAAPPIGPSPTPARTYNDAERRQLSVMFCDLVSSTALSESMDPEEFRELIATYQSVSTSAVRSYNGYIARYMGDGLLVYFGYPQAHEDDAERAVRAGLGIVEAVKNVDVQPGPELQVRVGIATGLVIAGDIVGEGASEERAVLGDTPNLAARLQAIAPPDCVVIAERTQRLVDGLFVLDQLGAQRLKGFSCPVTAYRVIGITDAPSRFEAAATRGLTPLVGREEEIGLLQKRWEQVTDGEGQVVLLSGEAGVGKSRIVRGFQDLAVSDIRRRVLCFCSAHHRSSALYPVVNQLERGMRFERSDSPAQKLDKLDAWLNGLELPTHDHGPILASLLSIPAHGRYPALELEPPALRRKTFESLISIFGAMGAEGPVFTVMEDAHWMDPSTEELIGLLIDNMRTLPLLLVVTHRPEYVPAWGKHAYATSLVLNRLGRRECAALIAKITEDKGLPSEVLDQIMARTDGIPLFVEELTKTVLDSDLLVDQGDRFELFGGLSSFGIPDSLQDSLMARLDRLMSSKEVAQLAATIGRNFDHDLLAAVSPMTKDNLESALAELVDAGLIYRRGVGDEDAYEFKHALIQEAAYQSLLKSKRRRFHKKIAGALERKSPTVIETEPELLAYHYSEAGNAEQAADYWQMAGRRAIQRSANIEAEGHIRRGLEAIRSLPRSIERNRRYATLQNTLGVCLMPTRGFNDSEVADAFAGAATASEEIDDARGLYVALRGLGQYQMISGNLRKASTQTDRVMKLAGKLNDSGALLEAHHLGWITRTFTGEYTAAKAHAATGIAMYQQERDHELTNIYSGHDPGVCCRSFGALPTWQLGFPDEAVEMCQEGEALAHELAHPFSLAVALWATGMLRQLRREASATLETAEAIIAYSNKGGFPLLLRLGHVMRGWAHGAEGDVAEGIAEIRRAIDQLQADGTEFALPSIYAHLGHFYGQDGAIQDGLAAVEHGLAIADRIGGYFSHPELHRIKGELLLADSAENVERAAACFERAVEFARGQDAKLLELRASVSLAKLLGMNHRREQGRELLGTIYGWFTEGFDTPDLKDAKNLVEELA